eukprot:CAMPEP_0172729980 /NCGR_PEP_ID=MMETSP1074-20121228/96508_1 /TAXON_ID=2916 /ORGANISM="Ceratium fusus, Strain PA161109" /LENGTH=963 /DNA_ID=CAMNT_0013557599 /DNA_START=72 /DNA_END=2963 /DNA_ORIENTATION=-
MAFQPVESADPCRCSPSSALGGECNSSTESDASNSGTESDPSWSKQDGKAVNDWGGCALRISQRSLLLIGLLVLAAVSLSVSHQHGIVVKSWAPVFFFDCQNIHIDSQSEALTEQQQWCCKHAKIDCPELGYDCRISPDSSPDWWSGEQRDWCCEHKQAGCPAHSYDCTQSSAPGSDWPQQQKDWCCEHSNVGCPEYDCQAGEDNSVASWSQEQKKWCCFHASVGCADVDAEIGGGVSGVSEGGGQLGAEVDSDDGNNEVYEPPDASGPTHNCQDGLWDWQQNWPDTKKHWCCTNQLLFCPSKWTDTSMAAPASSNSDLAFSSPATTASATSRLEPAFLTQDLRIQGLSFQGANSQRIAIRQAIAETLRLDISSVEILSLEEADGTTRRLVEGSVTVIPALPRMLPGPSFNGLRWGKFVKLTYKVSADAESAEIVLVRMAKVAHDPSSLVAKFVHCMGLLTSIQVMADAPRSMSEAPPTSTAVGTGHIETLPGSSVTSTTKVAYNCMSNDEYSSLQHWTAERRSWCCWQHHVGCASNTTVLQKGSPDNGGSGSSAHSTEEKPEVRDCHALEPSAWSDGKLQWCCKYFKWDCDHPSLFNCDAGLASWQMEWSAVKKVWCCKHRQKGCEVMTTTLEQYNCTMDSLRLQTGWSSVKKSWCCWHHGVGCVTTPAHHVSTRGAPSIVIGTSSMPASTAMSTTTRSKTATVTTTATSSTTTFMKPAPSTTGKPVVASSKFDGIIGKHTYNCVLDLTRWQTAWDEPKRRWCCDHFHWGCGVPSATPAAASIKTTIAAIPATNAQVSSATFDCGAGVSHYKVAWSAAKRHWCCLKEHLACDKASTGTTVAHNCSEGRATCITGWSLAKKSWCLKVGRQGCFLTTAPPLILPQAKAETFKVDSVVAQPHSVETLALTCLLASLFALVGFLAACRVRWATQLNSRMHADYMRASFPLALNQPTIPDGQDWQAI